jgi:hypothetical protein
MISRMSQTVQVQLFYGSGEIRYGPQGVDLSLFKTVIRDLTKAEERPWGVITNWLYKAFRKDEEQWKLLVVAVFNKSQVVFWELMHLEGTENWRRYVRSACTIGSLAVLLVQFLPNVGQSSHHGERGKMVERRKREDKRKRVVRRKRVGRKMVVQRKNKRGMNQLVWLMGEKKTLK